ncbi:MAG: DNA recombination protein RmuC [Bacteroidetes bacterium]|nr:DNA recombination protein RmuC [Bacteroidota bacterium]
MSEEKEHLQINLSSVKTTLDKLDIDYTEVKSKFELQNNQNTELKEYILKVRGENDVLKEKNNTIKKEIEDLGEKYTAQFKNLANEILEDKSKRFTEENQKNIRLILDPLGIDLKEFKKKVEETYEKENKQRFSLEEKIKDLVSLNKQISEEANNLTKALKGQRKTQGDWGEMILENILQQSGLSEGREYVKQEFLRDEAGNTLFNDENQKMQPDFVIKYPDKREIIIDSKVSLSAYERYSSSDDEVEQKVALEAHLNAVKKHIDELYRRNYQQFSKSLDFVMMFIPIEPAYMLAMQKDLDLWNYAYRKKVLLISPTNLIAAVKLLAELWKKDEQNKNALAIADRGAQLYDKFVGFVENLQSIGDSIGHSQKSYDEAMKQLKEGSGNLIGQAEKLRRLGVQGKKSLPGVILNDAEGD